MAAGDITVGIQYSVSATPTEEITLADDVNTLKSVHSKIDKTIGGGKFLDCGSGAPGTVADYVSHGLHDCIAAGSTFDTATGTTNDKINVVVCKIVENIGSASDDTNCDCEIALGGTNYEIKLVGVGDSCLLPTPDVDGSVAKIRSTSTYESRVDFLVGGDES